MSARYVRISRVAQDRVLTRLKFGLVTQGSPVQSSDTVYFTGKFDTAAVRLVARLTLGTSYSFRQGWQCMLIHCKVSPKQAGGGSL